MPNFIPKKDRRFPIGALFLIAYIVIGCIGAAVNAAVELWSQGYVGILVALGAFAWGFAHVLSKVAFIAIIIMLFAKVRHFTYAIPGAVGLGVSVLGFLYCVGLSIVSLVNRLHFIGLISSLALIVNFIKWLISNGAVVLGALFGMIGWISFILLAILSTKRSAKKVNWTLVFAFGACLIFASAIITNIISSFITLINVVSLIPRLGGMREILRDPVLKSLVIGELLFMISAGIAVVAGVFGLVGMLLAGIWLVKPAKRRYVPALPAEDVAEATCENGEAASAKRAHLKNLVDFYNE